MKVGICLLLLATANDPLAKECLPMIANAGYDYAEVSLARIYNLSDDEIDSYRMLIKKCGIPIESFNNAVPAGFSVVGDDATKEVQDAYINRSIKLAKQFGVSVITTSGPNAKRVPQGFDWAHIGYPRYIDFLSRFATECSSQGIAIALEPICKAECGFVNTIDQAMAIINDVSKPNLSLLVDMYHSSLEGEDFSRLEALARSGILTHMHVANLDSRTIPTLEYADVLSEQLSPLKSAEYNARISIEAAPVDIMRGISEGVLTVRKAFEK